MENTEVNDTLKIIQSTIKNCEKIKFKFSEGSSQDTLLKNRIKALYISKALLLSEKCEEYSTKDIKEAIIPITSIINKCETGIKNSTEGSSAYTRFIKLIRAMNIAKDILEKHCWKNI